MPVAVGPGVDQRATVDLLRHGQGVLNIVPLSRVVDALDAEILALTPREADTPAAAPSTATQAVTGS